MHKDCLYKFLRILCLSCLALPLRAQQWQVRHYDTDNGLPHDVVYQVKQDGRGYIWMCSDDGIARFDGYNWRIFRKAQGLQTNYTIDMAEGAPGEGRYYVATWGKGVHVFDGDSLWPLPQYGTDWAKHHSVVANAHWIAAWGFNTATIYPRQASQPDAPLPAYTLQLHASPSDGQVRPYILSGASERYGPSLTFSAPVPSDRLGVLLDGQRLLLYGGGAGIWELSHPDSSFRPFALQGESVWDMLPDGEGGWWASGLGRIWHFPPNSPRPDALHTRGLPPATLSVSAVNGDWLYLMVRAVGQKASQEAIAYHWKSGTVQHISKQIGTRAAPASINVDREGNVWVPTDGAGVYCTTSLQHQYLAQEVLPNAFINHIADWPLADGLVGVGTKDGLRVFDLELQAISSFYPNLEIRNWTAYMPLMVISAQQLLLGPPTGHLPAQNGWYDHALAHKGRLYHTSQEACLRSETGLPLLTKELWRVPAGERLQRAQFRPPHAWVASSKALRRLRLEGDTAVAEEEWPWPAHWGDFRVYDLLSQGDTLWAGSDIGLLRLANGQFERFSEADGLPHERCLRLMLDHGGALWVGTVNGLAQREAMGQWHVYNKQNGLLSNHVTALYEDRLHRIWVGSGKGITILDPRQPSPSMPLLPLYLTAAPPAVVRAGEQVSFSFKALHYANPYAVTYAYRIDQEPWRETRQDVAIYEALSHGPHVFEVRAKRLNEGWTVPIRHFFQVVPPWYRQPWIMAGGMVLALLGIVLFAQTRIRKARFQAMRLQHEIDQRVATEQQLLQVRQQIAKDFHDEMGNKLASITVLSNLITFKLREPSEEVALLLKKIEESSKELYRGTKDFIWAIDPKSDNLQELFTYLRDFGETFFQPLDLDFYVETEGQPGFHAVNLPPNWGRQLLLLAKEAMTNVAKYAQCTAVWLQVSWDPEARLLSLSVIDNGVGFLEEAVSGRSGNGLRNMRHRADRLSGRLSVGSELGKGTRVCLQVRLP